LTEVSAPQSVITANNTTPILARASRPVARLGRLDLAIGRFSQAAAEYSNRGTGADDTRRNISKD
jgi:hypothetical protein